MTSSSGSDLQIQRDYFFPNLFAWRNKCRVRERPKGLGSNSNSAKKAPYFLPEDAKKVSTFLVALNWINNS